MNEHKLSCRSGSLASLLIFLSLALCHLSCDGQDEETCPGGWSIIEGSLRCYWNAE